ncbi:hypothetical protein CPB84DRAFT_816935 [Gymnopilus junonius]|uniref:Uncharacterized protein n=1 Tax=Gymnopilus junonius TaxID=109634 RepID=A0A9P5NNB5_GYMJU|nr:hypothetical protein CPB84DRAFT_816935 [Gymnopilus junonius]
MKFYTAIGLAVSAFSTGAAAITCAVCPSSIVFEGLTRTLTTTREDTGNTIQCAYNTPATSGFSPACLYAVQRRRGTHLHEHKRSMPPVRHIDQQILGLLLNASTMSIILPDSGRNMLAQQLYGKPNYITTSKAMPLPAIAYLIFLKSCSVTMVLCTGGD